MITLNPFWAGFLKGLLSIIVGAVVLYLSDASHLTGLVSPSLAVLIAGIFAGMESHMKANSGGTTAIFGAVKVK